MSPRSKGWLLACALMAGCGAELDDGRPGDFVAVEPSAPDAPDGGAPDRAVDAAVEADMGPSPIGVEDYVGSYAHVQIQRGLAQLPVLGAEPTTTYGVMQLRIEPGAAEGELALTTRLCEVRIERERDVVTTEIPPTFIDALPSVERVATFVGERFEADWHVELRAVELENPADDPLPTEPDDPRIIDLDADGQPGLTARVSGLVDGEVYLVQRAVTRLTGQVSRDGHLDGLLGWTAEESIVAADDPLLETGAPFEADADPSQSVFLSTRLDEQRDCDWIVENQGQLFAR